MSQLSSNQPFKIQCLSSAAILKAPLPEKYLQGGESKGHEPIQ